MGLDWSLAGEEKNEKNWGKHGKEVVENEAKKGASKKMMKKKMMKKKKMMMIMMIVMIMMKEKDLIRSKEVVLKS